MVRKIERWLVLLPILIGLYFSWMNRYFFFDDALIYARYVENVLSGNGLVYNNGEYFNGLTSPLFTYLSIIVSYFTGNVIASINFLSGLFLILSLIFINKVFSSYLNKYYLLAGLLFIVSSPIVYSVFGMETFLFIFLIILSIYLFMNERYFWLLIVLALLILTRNEGIFLVIALVFEHLRLKRKFPNLKYFTIPVLLGLMHYSFNYFYYGALLPETGSAKIWQGMSGLWGENKPIFITGSKYLIDWVFGGKIYILYILLALSILGIYYLGKKSINIITLIFLALLLSFYSFLNIPNYHWYNLPFIVFLFVYASIGLKQLCILFNKLISFNALTIFLIIALVTSILYNNYKHLSFGKPNHPYIQIGNWIKNNTNANDSIAMVEIGIVGYFSERKIIDILGLVNPFNAKFIGERKFSKWLTKYRPEYILVHEPIWAQEQGVVESFKNGEYLEWIEFNFKGYKLFVRQDLKENKIVSNPYLEEKIYDNIIKNNTDIDKAYFSVRNYTLSEHKNARITTTGRRYYEPGKKNKTVLFSHVGTTFKVKYETLKPLILENHLKFGIGIFKEAYSGANKSEGACFNIYKNSTDEQDLIFKKCIDPLNNNGDRGILEFNVDLKQTADMYYFNVAPRDGKGSSWGWSFFTFYIEEVNMDTITKASVVDKNVTGYLDTVNKKILQLPIHKISKTEKELNLAGWFIDEPNKSLVKAVIVEINGKKLIANYGLSRVDVATALKNGIYENSGFDISISINELNLGKNSISLYVLSNKNELMKTNYDFNINVE